MTPFTAVLQLGALAILLGALLVLPAILEWLRPKDAKPLPIDNAWSRRDTVFAENFRRIAQPWWETTPGSEQARIELPSGHLQETTLLGHSVESGADARFMEEVWCRERLVLGSCNHARALLSDDSIELGRGTQVERWVHADMEVRINQDSLVHARVTSSGLIHLDRGCRTQLLCAPTIQWSGIAQPIPIEIPTHARKWFRRGKIPEAGKSWEIKREDNGQARTVFVNGDLILDHEADIEFPLVVRGNLYIRKGALIAGDLKAHGDLLVENSAVLGSLTCKGHLVVGSGSSVQGCLMGGESVWLGDGVIIGHPERLQAVSGHHVTLTGKGAVHGRIHAFTSLIEVQS